jgi:hypothetical protein
MRIHDNKGGPSDPARLPGQGRLDGKTTAGAEQTSATARAAPTGKPGGSVAPALDVGSRGDRLQLSQLASRLRAEDTESQERAALLDQLTADFLTGKYQPDTDAVSTRLMDEALET